MEQRVRATLALYAFAVFGVFLAVAPWTAVWDQAAAALAWGEGASSPIDGWLRGAITGLGLVDLGVAAILALDLWGRDGR